MSSYRLEKCGDYWVWAGQQGAGKRREEGWWGRGGAKREMFSDPNSSVICLGLRI